MFLSRTLLFYIGRQFFVWFLIVFAVIIALIILIDGVELLRRSAAQEEATFAIIVTMTLLRVPFLAQEAIPFAIMFGGIVSFLRLTRSHELVVVRAAGVSVWQFILPALTVAVLIGIFKVALLNPLSSTMLSQFEEMEGEYLTGRSSLLAVSSSGLWLRQPHEKTGQAVIHANRVKPEHLQLEGVIVFLLGPEDKFLGRIDAKRATLRDGMWDFSDAWLTGPDRPGEFVKQYTLATDFTADTIQESFSSAETIAFWNLPRFIKVLEATGFSARPHRLQFNALLAEPFLLMAMVLIAASFSLRLNRRGGTMILIGAGVLTSFLLFVLTNIIQAMGLGGTVPVVLAAWTPAGVSLMAGIGLLMHLEDG